MRSSAITNNDGDLRKIVNTYEKEDAQVQNFSTDINISSDTNNELGSFFAAIDFGAYQNSLLNSQIYSGANSIGHDITSVVGMGTSDGASGAVANMLFHYYAHYSAVLVMEKGSGEFTVLN